MSKLPSRLRKKEKERELRDTSNCMVTAGSWGVGAVEEGVSGIDGDGQRPDLE